MTTKIDDGGPAFPVQVQEQYRFEDGSHTVLDTLGLTVRDYFAAAALQGMSVRSLTGDEPITGVGGKEYGRMLKAPIDEKTIADWCYRLADAMLAARQGPTP